MTSRLVALLLLVGLALPVPAVQAQGHGPRRPPPGEGVSGEIVPAGREAWAVELLGGVGFEQPLAGGYVFDRITLEPTQVVYGLTRSGPPPTDVAQVRVLPKSRAAEGDRVGREFALRTELRDPAPQVALHVDAAVRSILARDRGGFFVTVRPPHAGDPIAIVLQVATAALLLWALALAVRLTRTRQWHLVRFRFQPTHLLPALLQVGIYAYWAAYVPAVAAQVPRLALLLIFAYALDFLLGLTLRRRWDATFGPVPVVLSANLFVWFPADALHLAFLVVALALGSKWLVQRDGRHLLNPSAAGIAVVGVFSLIAPEYGRFEDIAHLLAEPPHMMVLLLALALVAQLRVPIVLVTLAACAALLGLKHGGAWHVVYPFWPAVFLATTLLATDPATIPRTGAGRLLYGLAFGVLVWAVSAGLTALGQSDFYGKVLPLPLVNALVPWFDRLGERLGPLRAWLEPRWNLAHVAVWLLFAVPFVIG